MKSDNVTIHHVSDTALWVAHYRAIESERRNPLFQDPFAKILVGDRGKEIADSMKSTAAITCWTIIIRTHIIDNYIRKLVQEGVDMVLNLGAGMDTRPYRLNLPKNVQWIEVDYAHVIAHKEQTLKNETPLLKLERIALDLSDRNARKELFSKVAQQSKKILVLTEGVIPYLTEEQVATLAEDIKNQNSFCFWIAEYISPSVYRYYNNPQRIKMMRNAPFRFFPQDWFGFFKIHGWTPKEIRYHGEEGKKLNRNMPLPWWTKIFLLFASQKQIQEAAQSAGYVIFVRNP